MTPPALTHKMTRREAAAEAGRLLLDDAWRKRGAVGHAWTVGSNAPGLTCRVGLREPDGVYCTKRDDRDKGFPGTTHYRNHEFGWGWCYEAAIEDLKAKRAKS